MAEGSKSPWMWIGCGCAAIVAMGIVAVGAATFFGIRTARTMADPEKRHDKALELMDATAFPAGYESEIAVSVPLFADFVVLQGNDGQFVYLEGLRTKGDLRAAFDDDESFDREVRRAGLRVKRRQALLARNALQLGRAQLRYAIYEGELQFDASGNAGRTHLDFDEEGIAAETGAVIVMRCAEKDRPALILWAGPIDAGDDPEIDPGTAARTGLERLLGEFGFCPES